MRGSVVRYSSAINSSSTCIDPVFSSWNYAREVGLKYTATHESLVKEGLNWMMIGSIFSNDKVLVIVVIRQYHFEHGSYDLKSDLSRVWDMPGPCKGKGSLLPDTEH